MKALILLPFAPFEKEDLERLFVCASKRFKKPNIALYCHKLSFEYYSEKYPEYEIKIMIDSDNTFNYLTKDLFYSQCEEFVHDKNYIIVVANNIDRKIAAQPVIKENLPVYRWFILDGRIVSIATKTDLADDQEINSNIFAKIAKEAKSEFRLLPFGYMARFYEYGYINEFGFRVPKDYQDLKLRDKNHKLICAFGGSACFSMGAYEDEMWTARLENSLNSFSASSGLSSRYTVLNFGMMGQTVLEQIQTYILFAYSLKPDAVLSYDGFNDVVCGMITDSHLKEKFDYNYNFNYEEWAKIVANSEEKLAWKRGVSYVNPKNSPLVIAKSYYNRKKQFEQMSKEAGATFFSVYQPICFSKYANSERELKGYEQLTDVGIKRDVEYIKLLYKKVSEYLKTQDMFNAHLNLHDDFSLYGDESTIFYDMCHTVPYGDSLIAEMLLEFIKSWCLSNG